MNYLKKCVFWVRSLRFLKIIAKGTTLQSEFSSLRCLEDLDR